MTKPAVVLIGADKGGVGKTMVARTLLDYFSIRSISTRAFDTEWPKGALKRFNYKFTEVVDVTSVADQMKIFDTIESSGTQITLIDVRAGLMSPTLQALSNIGFLDMNKANQINFLLFHILGPSISSLDEIAETSRFLVDARYFIVKNFVNNTSFFEWDKATYNSYFKQIPHAVEIAVPKLSEMACEQVELASVPFGDFIANKTATGATASNSFVLRGYLRHWLNNVFSEYERVRLTDIVVGTTPKDTTSNVPATVGATADRVAVGATASKSASARQGTSDVSSPKVAASKEDTAAKDDATTRSR
jgi:hypothetical protein